MRKLVAFMSVKQGAVAQVIGEVGEKKPPYKPADSNTSYFSLDLLVPGKSYRVSCSEDQWKSVREGQIVRATCDLDSTQKGLRMKLNKFELVETAAK